MTRRTFLCMICLCMAIAIYGIKKEINKKSVTKPVTAVARPLNPISPPGLYIADPEARVMPDGRVYIYGSLDEPGNTWCSHHYDVLSSTDLVHWNVEQTSFATRGEGKQADYTDRVLYAPDCIYHQGKYYLYYCLADGGDDEGVAVSDSPTAPLETVLSSIGPRG